MVVDQSLSKGLADSLLVELDGIHVEFIRSFRQVLIGRPQKRKSVREKSECLLQAGERAALTQFYAHHPRWRWSTWNIFLPFVTQTDAGRFNRLVFYKNLRLHIANSRQVDFVEPRKVFAVTEHAFERLFQRLNVMNALQVREEIHDALSISLILCQAASQLGLQQMVVPSKSGAFLCHFDADDHLLVAKTWVKLESVEPVRSKIDHAAEVILSIYKNMGQDQAVARCLGEMSIYSDPSEIYLWELFAKALGRIDWLRDKYAPGFDPVGRTWMLARKQERDSLNS